MKTLKGFLVALYTLAALACGLTACDMPCPQQTASATTGQMTDRERRKMLHERAIASEMDECEARHARKSADWHWNKHGAIYFCCYVKDTEYTLWCSPTVPPLCNTNDPHGFTDACLDDEDRAALDTKTTMPAIPVEAQHTHNTDAAAN